MLKLIHFINIALPLFYILTFVVYYLDFVKETLKNNRLKRAFLYFTVSLHLVYLILRFNEFGHVPITSKYEIFSVLAFAIGLSFFVLKLFTDVHKTGVFIISISMVFQLLSTFFIADVYEVKDILKNNLLGLHVVSAMIGLAGFTVSSVYGVLFVILYKEIKLNNFGIIFNRLPSLEMLEKLSFYSVAIGFVMLSFAMAVGIIWLPSAFTDFTYLDPKLISTSIIWLILGTGILGKLAGNWYGKKVIKFFLIGYVLSILSMFLANVLFPTFHSFY